MTVFRSKVGYGILIPVLILMLGISLIPLMLGAPFLDMIPMLAVMIPSIAFTLYIFLNTSYRITDEHELIIKCGFLYHRKVNISSIQSITPTRNPIASPAASLDRLVLQCGKWDSVIISPENKTEFVAQLLEINPDIQCELKG